MNLSRISFLFLSLFLLLALITPLKVSAQSDFNAFYAKFKKAATANNRSTLRNMMPSNCLWGIDDYITCDEGFRSLTKQDWAQIRKAVPKTPKRCKQPYCGHGSGFRSGYYLITSSFTVLFMLDRDEWKWVGVLGD